MTAEDWKRRSVYQTQKISQHRGLQRQGTPSKTFIHLEILSDLTDKPLERELADEKLCRLLIPSDFTKSNSPRAEPVRLLDTTGGGLKGIERVKKACHNDIRCCV